MLGDSAVLGGGGGGEGGGSSGDAVAAAVLGGGGGGGVGSNSGDDERGRIDEGERSFGGNRWPRQETLALLRIRSDMDVVFRDASVKGPLWEEVARKMAELGYHRSSKKCKEKFENVYKYHKRTKEGRGGKQDGKTYRFFDQLEALDHNHHSPTPQPPNNPSSKPQQAPPIVTTIITTTTTTPMPPVLANNTLTSTVPQVTVPSTTPLLPIPIPQAQSMTPNIPNTSINLTLPSFPPPPPTILQPHPTVPISFPTELLSNSSSSSTSSDEIVEGRGRKRKRKWKDFFERLMKEVVEKQEEMHKRFLEAIEKREHDRMAREEAWRVQEMQRINREREILAQERSIASAKDAAVMSFLQKIAEQQNLGQPLNNINNHNIVQPQPTVTLAPAAPTPPPVQQLVAQPVVMPVVPHYQQQQQQTPGQQQPQNMEIVKVADDNGENMTMMASASSSRWPKVEVEALIKLRTSLDAKYQENCPKGPLWEEISASMRKLGYNRSSKRCKEKWENINKYFKKVKESNKKRPQDSKTCPYFHQLDALYRERNKVVENPAAMQEEVKPENMAAAPLMVRPEQQWPPQQQDTRDVTMEDEDDEDEDDHVEEEDDDEEDEGGNFEIVASKPPQASLGASAE